MKEKLSNWGKLRKKLDNSGINGAPIISDKELKELLDLTAEAQNLMIDIECQPLVEYFQRHFDTVKMVIWNRRNV